MARDQATTTESSLGQDAPVAPARRGLMSRLRWPLMIGGPLLILLIAAYFVLTGGRSELTDDFYVQAARVPVSASIGGRVTELDVSENQFVHKGQVLFKLDVRDFDATQEQAAAQLAGARLQVQALDAAYQQQLAALKMAKDTAVYADSQAARQKSLLQVGVSSRDQYETAQHNADVAHQSVSTAQQMLAQALANLGGANLAADQHPQVQQAQAALDRARINVSYGTVVAAQDGVVTRVEQLQVGSYVNSAQTLFWLVAGARGSKPTSRKTNWPRCRSDRPPRSTSTPVRARISTARSPASAPAPDRRSRRCRPRTPLATGSKWCSACRCGSRLMKRRRPSAARRGSAPMLRWTCVRGAIGAVAPSPKSSPCPVPGISPTGFP